jgi:hypothetical protein
MSNEQAVKQAVDNLWEDDLDGLYMSLATRAQAAEKGEAQEELEKYDADEFELPPLDAEQEGGDITAVIKKLSEKWWEKFEPKIYDLLCNKKNPEHTKFLDSLGGSAKELAMLLAPSLVASVAGALPAVVVVVATIAAKKIAESGLEAMCEVWGEARAEAAKEDKEEAKPGQD